MRERKTAESLSIIYIHLSVQLHRLLLLPAPQTKHIIAGEEEYPCTPQLMLLQAVRIEKIALNCVSSGEEGGNKGNKGGKGGG